jgi:cytochrome P450
MTAARLAAFPGLHPTLGVLPLLQTKPLRVMELATFDFGPVARLPLPGAEVYVLGHPSLAHHVLVTQQRRYGKQTDAYRMLRQVLGDGLISAEGEPWRRHRRLVQPAFHRGRVAAWGAQVVRATHDLAARWPLRRPFDVAPEFMRLSLRVVGEVLLSRDVTSGPHAFVGKAVRAALGLVDQECNTFVPTPSTPRLAGALEALDPVVFELIRERRAEREPKGDLLSLLLEARDADTNEPLDDRQLRDEVVTLFFAGHETTGHHHAWTTMLLAREPAAQERLYAEARAVVGHRAATADDVGHLTSGAQVLRESLRLSPPVWSLGRTLLEDDEVEGFHFPKGAVVLLCAYALHWLPAFWPEPLRFQPRALGSGRPAAAPRSGPALLPRPANVHRRRVRAARGSARADDDAAAGPPRAGPGAAVQARADGDAAAPRRDPDRRAPPRARALSDGSAARHVEARSAQSTPRGSLDVGQAAPRGTFTRG